MAIYQIGRTGRRYCAQEATYGVAPTLVATDALRHLSVKMSEPTARVNSPERHVHPSQVYRFTRRRGASYSVSGILYPSGTLNTLPDMAGILEATFGSQRNVTLSTTVAASPSPTTTVFTVASVTGLAVGDPVLINATTGGRQVRWITAINTLALTVAPALSAAPVTGDTVKGCVGYTPTTALLATGSLDLAWYRTSISYEMKGCAPDSLKIMVDANDEVRFELSGPAATRTRPAQSDPATFTVAGSAPPSGLTGYLRVNAGAEEFLKASFELKNGIELDNVAFGTSAAQAMYRAKKREVAINLETMVSDDVTILDLAANSTDHTHVVQCGLTEGSIVAWYCPLLELEMGEDPDNDETNVRSHKGVAKGSGSGNNELYLALA